MEDVFVDFLDMEKKYLIVIIYDISDNKRRTKLGRFLSGYGMRIQRSAFECLLSKKVYYKLLGEIKRYLKDEDLIKVYKIDVNDREINRGISPEFEIEEIIII